MRSFEEKVQFYTVKLLPLLPVTNLKLKKMANRTFAYPSAIFLGCSTVFLALFPLKKQVLRSST